MEMVDELANLAASFAESAMKLNSVYEKRYNAGHYVGAIIFDNLRVDEEKLTRKMAQAKSTNERIRNILDSFQNEIITLSDFLSSALYETKDAETELISGLQMVIARLNSSLQFIARMRNKLNDSEMPVSMYSEQLEKIMTDRVQAYLHESSPNELVYAVRNYAIVTEVFICAEFLVDFLRKLQTDV